MANPNTEQTLKSLQSKYEVKDYDGVIKLLLENKSVFHEGIFHYNLGTAYLKKENFPAARLHFEKSLAKGHIGPHLFKNLEATKKKISAYTFESSRSMKDEIFSQSLSVPIYYFHTITLVIILTALLLKKFSKIKKISFIFILLLGLVPSGLGLILKNNYNSAILLSDVSVYEGPSEAFDKSTQIPGGVKIIIKKANDNWLYIVSPVFYSGWIQRKKIGIF